MTEYSSITVLHLLKFKIPTNLEFLNKGFNDEVKVGLFKMVGYNKEHNQFLITKPITNEPSFILTEEQYRETFDTLLIFKLNNN
jgi:hypothetical protein